jgi:hypothetical protein
VNSALCLHDSCRKCCITSSGPPKIHPGQPSWILPHTLYVCPRPLYCVLHIVGFECVLKFTSLGLWLSFICKSHPTWHEVWRYAKRPCPQSPAETDIKLRQADLCCVRNEFVCVLESLGKFWKLVKVFSRTLKVLENQVLWLWLWKSYGNVCPWCN